MRKTTIIVLAAFVLILSGCMPDEYAFPNKDETVVKIDLLSNPQANERDVGTQMDILRTLEGEIADAFLEELYQLETSRCTTPPPRGYGFYIARVEYQNGDVEMFGSRHIELIEKGSTPFGVGSYFFQRKHLKSYSLSMWGKGTVLRLNKMALRQGAETPLGRS